MKIIEQFFSIQGEALSCGKPTVFVRTQGCKVGCKYCDTKFSWNPRGGEEIGIGDLLLKTREIDFGHCGRICLTGGEPLEQDRDEVAAFVSQAVRVWRYDVEIETSGTHAIAPGWPCTWIVDLKTPCSGVEDKMYFSNLAQLTPNDSLVCVIAGKEDFDYVVDILGKYPTGAEVFFNPEWGSLKDMTKEGNLKLEELVHWIKKYGRGRLGMQMHKLIWGEKHGV